MIIPKKQKFTSLLLLLFIFLNINNVKALENKILFKIDNEIITTVDIYEEIKFLKIFNPEINNLSEDEIIAIFSLAILIFKLFFFK